MVLGGTIYHRVATDEAGNYAIGSILPGRYYLKVGAGRFADEWFSDATHRTNATPYAVAAETVIAGVNFDLLSGQNPALAEVTSEPSGAEIYLDFQPTGQVTPAIIDVGEVGDTDWSGAKIASHTITVKKAGRPVPSPRQLATPEAETVSLHFDLTSDEAGTLSISTVPTGAEVFVDYADAAAGVSPVEVGNLAPGSHVILLRKSGYLQPKPIVAWVTDGGRCDVYVPLEADTSTERLKADVRSVPPGADVYVDYLPTPDLVTDVVVDWMDPASHAGTGWHSASHTIMLRKPGYKPMAPRYVPEEINVAHVVMVHQIQDAEAMLDEDHDGLPDQWQDAYALRILAPDKSGPDDDADGDGASNEQELGAGTNPMDKDSVFSVVDIAPPRPDEVFVLAFNSVPGRSYIVLTTDDLGAGWAQASGIIEATDYLTIWTSPIPADEANLFFRVITLNP